MNSNVPVQRNRAPTNGSGPVGRPSNEGQTGPGGAPGMSRAEKFEDEKRRIIESCFGKKDHDGSHQMQHRPALLRSAQCAQRYIRNKSFLANEGQSYDLLESYITHIRIVEDAAHPSSPPPPDSSPENKKFRLIIVAVRKSGRVRVHKARENDNSSFSIGKTWNLDDLTAIESFSSVAAAETEEQQQRKQWAGGVGFMVTIQKPYYWQATTPKEKEFFIASLVKIYRKYTGGKLPKLTGFDPRETEQSVGPPAQQPRNDVAVNDGTQPQRRSPSDQGRGQPPGRPVSPSREPGRRPSQEQSMRRPDNRDPPQRQPGQHPPNRPAPAPAPYLSQVQLRSTRANSPGNPGNTTNVAGPPPSFGPQNLRKVAGRRSVESFQNEQQAPTVGRIPFNVGAGRGVRQDRTPSPDVRNTPPGSQPTQSSESNHYPSPIRNGTPPALAPGIQSRSRSRPPIPGPLGSVGQQSSRGKSNEDFSTPLSTPGIRREDGRTPPRGSDRPARESPTAQSELRSGTNGYFTQSNGVGTVSMDLPPGTHFEPPLVAQHEVQSRARHENFPAVVQPPMPQAPAPKPPITPVISTQATHLHGSPHPQENIPQVPIPQTFTKGAQNDGVISAAESPATPISPLEPPPEPKNEEFHRPGLGPMIKKKSNKDIANQFRKAANAYNAFKPRAGGAGDRVREGKESPKDGPDGITSVVPAPSLLRGISQGNSRSATPSQPREEQPLQVQTPVDTPRSAVALPQVEVTSPKTETPVVNGDRPGPPQVKQPRTPSPDKSRSKSPQPHEARKQKRRSERTAKYIAALGINPMLLEDRALDIEPILSEFGWDGESSRAKQLETLEADIKREIGRVEAGSWLGHLEQKDERVEAVETMLDKAIAECDEMDGLLTLYGAELNVSRIDLVLVCLDADIVQTLNDDVAYIEAQSQGLQVQTANQKLLHTDLENLLQTISIKPSQLRFLRDASMRTSDGMRDVEHSLSLLYKAMVTVDPSLRGGIGDSNPRTSLDGNMSSGGHSNSEIGSMRALQERKANYRNEVVIFVRRLKQYMVNVFGVAVVEFEKELKKDRDGGLMKGGRKLHIEVHDAFRADLWQYSPLMLFTRQFELLEWEEMMRMYETSIKKPYQEEFKANISAWKNVARNAAGEEQEVLFTSSERETEGIATAARKMTVKRSQTLAKTLRAGGDSSTGRTSSDKVQGGKMYAYEAFTGALDEMVPIISMEQNFMVDFFHLSSLGNPDFSEVVAAVPLDERKGTDLTVKKLFDPDRTMAKRLAQSMEEIYSFWPSEMQSLVDWAIQIGPLQGVGVLGAVERKLLELEETNQEYLAHTLLKIRDRLTGLFSRFLDEQIRAIEETKVKIKKRKGIITFMKKFPNFSTAIENMLPPVAQNNDTDLRLLVNDAYSRLNKAMFESLKVIAKESPAVMAGQGAQGQGAGDPEDKEALNYHILLIENMNHYIEEVDARDNGVLKIWKRSAAQEMHEHMELYLGAIIRRPLGKLLDFLESTESLLLAAPSPPTIATRASHSRSTFKKILANHDNKEIRRGIDTLKKRIEKHFGDADDPALSRGLVQKVYKECESRYLDIGERAKRINDSVYEGQLEVEWKREDVSAAFRR
ncbi:MAG: hypothetical protein M1812_004932 [Candelaria pacifica]|nr:MAG: hypothetical protein M1812_004932 [Candelaria pacifica]